eukprot:CAMPEP_0206230406 /NCGR_PEP_ID=MMETSP0047_2-20121206/10245_1 /ASSEMBLY_ACC=CAM_ASM_000192 /TAXON_ID=195065 /ORGANISM="Chroomonas mesostigmatica_cf, Strain CCMP1168" /LENGTH=56 /DNA_ID=CAMNT_0053653833 /DNA_START=57 /DNA_END=224 /DNA_ORIENTATION=-
MFQTAAQERQVTEIRKAISSATKAAQAGKADFPSLVTEAGEPGHRRVAASEVASQL